MNTNTKALAVATPLILLFAFAALRGGEQQAAEARPSPDVAGDSRPRLHLDCDGHSAPINPATTGRDELEDDGQVYREGAIVQSLSELVTHSARIAIGRFVGARCARGEGEDQAYIFTFYRFEIDESLRGSKGRVIEVRVAGGSLPEEGISMGASHQPEFRVGDHGVLFVDRDPRLFTHVTAGKQGFLRFQETARGRRVQDGFGRTITGIGGATELVTEPLSGELDGDVFLDHLRALAG